MYSTVPLTLSSKMSEVAALIPGDGLAIIHTPPASDSLQEILGAGSPLSREERLAKVANLIGAWHKRGFISGGRLETALFCDNGLVLVAGPYVDVDPDVVFSPEELLDLLASMKIPAASLPDELRPMHALHYYASQAAWHFICCAASGPPDPCTHCRVRSDALAALPNFGLDPLHFELAVRFCRRHNLFGRRLWEAVRAVASDDVADLPSLP